MKYVGAHVSIAGGREKAFDQADNIGASAFAIFVKNQRQWFSKPLTDEQISSFKEALKNSKIQAKHILPHAGYLINLANPDDEKLAKSRKSFEEEIKICDQLGLELLNVHPGSHLGKISEKEAIKRISESINIAISNTKNVKVVIENTSGQGNYLGHKMEQIFAMIEKVDNKSRIGVCLDSCHLFGAGYDIRTKETFDNFFSDFDKIGGFKYLIGMHLNDSKIELGSRKDRHQSIGEGLIGLEFFKLLMKDKRFDEIPLILETPNPDIYAQEIAMLNKFIME